MIKKMNCAKEKIREIIEVFPNNIIYTTEHGWLTLCWIAVYEGGDDKVNENDIKTSYANNPKALERGHLTVKKRK